MANLTFHSILPFIRPKPLVSDHFCTDQPSTGPAEPTARHVQLLQPPCWLLNIFSFISFSLTVDSQEVIEQLEEGETVPAVGRLNFKSCVHVGRVETQEGLSMLHHQVWPPRKGLQMEYRRDREGGETEYREWKKIKRLRVKDRRQIRQREGTPQWARLKNLRLTVWISFAVKAEDVM